MENFKKRLLSEYGELGERKDKLKKFIETDKKFCELDSKMQYVMRKQLEYMTGYWECLKERIAVLIGWEEIEKNAEGVEAEIISDKECRVEIDNALQKVKNLTPSRERSLAITKLQEGIMWLGMDLKRLGNENPYPDGMNPENANVAKTADGLKL